VSLFGEPAAALSSLLPLSRRAAPRPNALSQRCQARARLRVLHRGGPQLRDEVGEEAQERRVHADDGAGVAARAAAARAAARAAALPQLRCCLG